MRSYKNEELGFEIEIPENWHTPILESQNKIVFDIAPSQTIIILVERLSPERLLEFTQYEFMQYCRARGYTGVEFGRIYVENKEHVCAIYNMGNDNWAKKYMIVFDYVEYGITGLCSGKKELIESEKQWDTIVRSFKLVKWREKEGRSIKGFRSKTEGELYEEAYELAEAGRYQEACLTLEKCLRENPNHIQAHKELAFILKNTGDVKGACMHRQIVKKLDPSDQINQYNLAIIYYMLGSKIEAMLEIDELLLKQPNDERYIATRKYFITNSN
ncbi:MAG TPA: hypothetical protein VLX61_01650 [Anaerolineales bacterium]|nr:hypothetical protein [Anaerolineales bacterium]